MSLEDVVVDTNVFVHSHNQSDAHHEMSRDFVLWLHGGQTSLCHDRPDGGEPPTSKILAEYAAHVSEISLASQVIADLLTSGRWRAVDGSIDKATRDWLKTRVRDRSDHVFAIVASRSEERHLVSHDDRAFTAEACADLADKFGVHVCGAGHCPRDHPQP